ncbi:hypothetical protein CEUSTIGMA_g1554.t1 [Chlamydomonas eustigma]|uniref:Sfi1 spindle body domain-containing protein n=1 Tax=Chlamydomonas eustigma TaxID=1157962 RepID=A0A250WTG9_9CHLO|nr:hypothetical protein CEUSTIGMA_g1554.t1 [Chlamydomonas eustigma]|eukprot:GAX74105.1 hypothetical protein CEUSTIGMA_g1554.t1 [Chlamydomonas eustigma]
MATQELLLFLALVQCKVIRSTFPLQGAVPETVCRCHVFSGAVMAPHDLLAQAIALRSLEARELVLQRACLRIWKRYFMHLFMKAELFSEGCRRVHSVQLRHSLTAWKCVCERQQAKLAVLDLVFSWRRQRGLSLALTGWHSVVNIRLAAVHRGEIALQHCCGSLMKKALRAWENFLKSPQPALFFHTTRTLWKTSTLGRRSGGLPAQHDHSLQGWKIQQS